MGYPSQNTTEGGVCRTRKERKRSLGQDLRKTIVKTEQKTKKQ
jgi:hypothetical protein